MVVYNPEENNLSFWNIQCLGFSSLYPSSCLKCLCLGLLHVRIHLTALTSRKLVRKITAPSSSDFCHFLSAQQGSIGFIMGEGPLKFKTYLKCRQNHCDPKWSFWWESSWGLSVNTWAQWTRGPTTLHTSKTRPSHPIVSHLNWPAKSLLRSVLSASTQRQSGIHWVWVTSERTHRWAGLLALKGQGDCLHLPLPSNKPWIELI